MPPSFKILVSGFEAFGGEKLNPTHMLVDELRAGRVVLPPNVKVEGVLLPVGFATAFEAMSEAITRFQPSTVLALGQAGGRDSIELEQIAANLMHAEIPDNNGWQPQNSKIAKGQPDAYFSSLPLRELLAGLQKAGIPSRLSRSAGRYVCNYLFYRLQAEGPLRGVTASGFVHFPYLPEQGEPKQKPSMPFATMVRALEIMLAQLSAS